jgi:YbbR domain-containing protein
VPRSDLVLRLVALVIAACLVVFVSGERRVTTDVAVRVEVRYPPGLAPVVPPPREVSVSLTGPWARLRGVVPEDLGPIALDLSREVPGTHSWYVKAEALRLPRGVRVEGLHPAQGNVELRPLVDPTDSLNPTGSRP